MWYQWHYQNNDFHMKSNEKGVLNSSFSSSILIFYVSIEYMVQCLPLSSPSLSLSPSLHTPPTPQSTPSLCLDIQFFGFINTEDFLLYSNVKTLHLSVVINSGCIFPIESSNLSIWIHLRFSAFPFCVFLSIFIVVIVNTFIYRP